MSELKHYGVLGMKWGVRRDKELLGRHTIPKGTTMYRTTATKDEDVGGLKYVTYLAPDRDLYRGLRSDNILKVSGKNVGDEVYEQQYKLKEDLNIPSREELASAYDKVMSDFKARKDAVQGYVDQLKGDPNFENAIVSRMFSSGDFSYEKAASEEAKRAVDLYLGEYGKSKLADFALTSISINESPVTKSRVVAELKKRGYNAMIDEASVGIGTMKSREGVSPLIVFDGNNSLSKNKTVTINSMTKKIATNKYKGWFDVANANKDKGDW